jgi:diguanylate cyclase (GGDEF)-like protein/PAS domain S-box-containing protein
MSRLRRPEAQNPLSGKPGAVHPMKRRALPKVIPSKNARRDLRQQAEAALREFRKRPGPLPETEADTRRLLHALQVRQIELEMQNEELVQSQAELEAASRQYANLYDFAPVGYFTLGRDGAIHKVNLSGANLLGVARGKLLKRRLGVFVSAQSRVTFSAFLDKVFAGGSKDTCEIALLKDGSAPVWVQIAATVFVASTGEREVCHAVLSDITGRRQAEEALRYLSTHDALTGLYNRAFFVEEMARLERGRQFPVSIVMADVDSLKNTNDQEGHAAGDALLKRVAQVLTAAFRTEDVVARVGGDEFAVLLPGTGAAVAEVSLRRVRQVAMEHNAAHAGAPVRLSLGVSTAGSAAPLSNVLKEADANMYREKRERDVSQEAHRSGAHQRPLNRAASRKRR